MNKKRIQWIGAGTLALGMMGTVGARGQNPAPGPPPAPAQDASQTPPAQAPAAYQPKFSGDPARSESEAQALG